LTLVCFWIYNSSRRVSPVLFAKPKFIVFIVLCISCYICNIKIQDSLETIFYLFSFVVYSTNPRTSRQYMVMWKRNTADATE
jgi:hypothetical protein